jgi:hypothetical protein
MIERRHRKGDADSVALYSPDLTCRYALTRRWGEGPQVLFVMLNPSTATEVANDPTIERCERRARAWGMGALAVANLFAWRCSRPEGLRRAADPVGADNDRVLLDLARRSDLVLCAWGVHGAHLGRDRMVADLLRSQGLALHHLGLTRAGAPRHPLYLPYSAQPQPWV